MTFYITALSSSLTLLIFFALWKYIWVPTLKCHYQDKFYRLRLELMSLIEKDCSNDKERNPIFVELIDHIESYRKDISKVSLLAYIGYRRTCNKNPELLKYLDEINAREEMYIKTLKNEETKILIVGITDRISKLLLDFMFLSTPIHFAVIALMIVLFDLQALIALALLFVGATLTVVAMYFEKIVYSKGSPVNTLNNFKFSP